MAFLSSESSRFRRNDCR